MTRLIVAIASAGAGLLFCIGSVLIANALEVTPEFPAFAGEDDFGPRVTLFLMFVWPAFAAIGAWIGYSSSTNWRLNGRRWLGVALATLLTFGSLWVVAPAISQIQSRGASNFSAFASMLTWCLLSLIGALMVGRRRQSP